MNLRLILSSLTLLATLLVPVTGALAQVVDAADVREAIEKNAELLEHAASLVHETNSIKARSSLETARSLHIRSVTTLEQGYPGLAARIAMRAREVILQTIGIAKREARLEEQAHMAMERAASRLEHARAALEEHGGHDDSMARRLIQEAGDHLVRARDHLQEHMFEVARQLADASADMSVRALRLIRRDAIEPDDLSAEIERTDQVLDRLADFRGALPPSLSRLADEAHDLQRRAKQSAMRDELRPALEQTRRAREAALRALRVAGASSEPAEEDAERALAFTDELIESAKGIAREQSLEPLARRLEEATRLQATARERLHAHRYGQAAALTLRAREIVRESLRKVDSPLDPEAVEDALARTEDVVTRLRERLGTSEDAGAQALLARAVARQEEARQAVEAGELRRALALTKVANNLARKALRRLGDEHM